MAVVNNPHGTIVIGMSGGSEVEGITERMVLDFIEKDLARYPALRTKAAAIQDILIVSDESISSGSYAQDMTQAYLRHMHARGWESPEGLHIFEIRLAQVTVYIAYGI